MNLATSSALPELKMAAPKRPVVVGSKGWDELAYRFVGIFLCSRCRAPNIMLVEYNRDSVTWPEVSRSPDEDPLETFPEAPGGELDKVAHILARWDFSDCSSAARSQ